MAPMPSPASRNTFGRWQANKSDLTKRQGWRIVDQDWHFDVSTEPNVPHRDAEQIVLAIYRRQLVNALPTTVGPLRLNVSMPADIDANEITCISQSKSEVGAYEVRTGQASGLLLQVNGAQLHIGLSEKFCMLS